MFWLKAYAGVVVSFLAIDAVWISRVVKPMYDREVGGLLRETPQMGAAAVFYLMYAAGVVWFAVQPAHAAESVRPALLNGAIFGGLAYGTYAFTNHAVLRGWTWSLVVADVLWGVALTAAVAACGYLVSRIGS